MDSSNLLLGLLDWPISNSSSAYLAHISPGESFLLPFLRQARTHLKPSTESAHLPWCPSAKSSKGTLGYRNLPAAAAPTRPHAGSAPGYRLID